MCTDSVYFQDENARRFKTKKCNGETNEKELLLAYRLYIATIEKKGEHFSSTFSYSEKIDVTI